MDASTSQIFKMENINFETSSTEQTISISIYRTPISDMKILAFYVTAAGEIIVDDEIISLKSSASLVIFTLLTLF